MLPAEPAQWRGQPAPTLQSMHSTLVPGWTLDSSGSSAARRCPGDKGRNCRRRDFAVALDRRPDPRAGDWYRSRWPTAFWMRPDATLVAYAALDGTSGGAPLTLSGCTVVGKVHAQELVAGFQQHRLG